MPEALLSTNSRRRQRQGLRRPEVTCKNRTPSGKERFPCVPGQGEMAEGVICPIFLYLMHHQEAQTQRSVRFLRERSCSRSLDPGTCWCTNTAQNKAGRRGEEGKAKRTLSKINIWSP